MRKEKIEKVPPASLDHSDIEAAPESLQSPLTTPVVAARDPLAVTAVESVMVAAQPSTPSGEQCKTETADGEPPRKRGRYDGSQSLSCLMVTQSLNGRSFLS